MAYHYAKHHELPRDQASGMLFVGLIFAAMVIIMAALAPASLLTQVTAGLLVLYVMACVYLVASNAVKSK
jgi:hypothetical protein